MTDADLPPDTTPDDLVVEIASRYIDGDLSVDERARADADPAVLAWVERLAGVRAALAAPIAVDAADRDRAIVAALDAFRRRTRSPALADGPRAPVVSDLCRRPPAPYQAPGRVARGSRRHRRHRRRRQRVSRRAAVMTATNRQEPERRSPRPSTPRRRPNRRPRQRAPTAMPSAPTQRPRRGRVRGAGRGRRGHAEPPASVLQSTAEGPPGHHGRGVGDDGPPARAAGSPVIVLTTVDDLRAYARSASR